MNLPNQKSKSRLDDRVSGQHSRMSHPFKHGQIFFSPGAHFSYRVIGACCRLFDRETLPYPCCRLEWHSKEPSWRRIGKRLIADLATRNSPSYSVEIIGQAMQEPLVMTLYSVKLPQPLKEWWVSSKPSTSTIADLTWLDSAEEIKIEG
ncbi:hypothetical protein [Phormidesmis priestleyi]|uniref:hypothetical protein n=1 Tax=Phormidesmis priestleyi TaxID=268141 RepID=UPI001FD10ADB|nr:hypothetical protein [Phormidesmis priestleyi]